MAFTSVDDLVAEISAGKIHRSDWQYRLNAAITTGNGISSGANLSSFPGQFGTPNAFPGTALEWVTCNDSTGNGTEIFGIPHGGNVSPDKKHLISAAAFATPGSTGGTLVLMDLQGYWPGISHTTLSTQTLTGTPSLRYTNGAGCRLFSVATATLGVTAHNITINYKNQSNNTSSTGATAARASSIVGQILSAVPQGASSLFFRLVDGDTGIQNVVDVTMSAVVAAPGGTSALCLARPIAYVPLVAAAYNVNEKEFVYQTPSMPEIKDGACLVWLFFSAAAASVLPINSGWTGHIETAWG